MSKEHYKAIPAVFLVLKKGNQILLLRRFNTGYQDGNYTFVSGHVEANEMPIDALIREAKEEANITLKREDIHLVHTMYREGTDGMRMDLFFTADVWEGEITNMEPNKCDDLQWFDLDQLPTNCIPFVNILLAKLKEGISYSEVAIQHS